MHSQTKIFSRRVKDYMRASPLVLEAHEKLPALLAGMAEAAAESALVVGSNGSRRAGRLVGIVTERDVARRIALRATGNEEVQAVMTPDPYHVAGDDYLYYAIAAMRRRGLRHMPVVDHAGHPIGVINLHQALAVAGEQTVAEIDRLCQSDSLDGLREIKAAQVELARSLLADHVPAPDILGLISHVNGDIHHRLIENHIAGLDKEGRGRPPVDFCFIVMGSGGRGENYLYPDQDNGMILGDYPDEDHGRIDAYFIELAERLNRDLDAVGFPLCRGYVMARNPLWRKTRSQWRKQVQLWGRRRNTIAIQLSDIFFDFRGVYGEAAWALELRHEVTRMARKSPIFLREMLEEAQRAQVALGLFSRLTPEKGDPEHKGSINLKHRGTLPLVSNLRLLALRHGIEETGTRDRLDALRQAGVLSRDDWDYLGGAFRHITFILLRQQLADFDDPKREVSNFVPLKAMTEREKDMLIDSFKAVEELADRVDGELTGQIL